MNMSTKCECGQITPSPQDNIFKLKSNSKSKTKGLLDTEVDLSDFLLKQIGSQSKKVEVSSGGSAMVRQYEIVNKMFGSQLGELRQTGCGSPIDLQDNSDGAKFIKGNFKGHSAEVASDQNTPKSNFDAAVPSIDKCSVCNENFQNYFQHISTAAHKKRQNSSISIGKSKVALQTVITNLINSLEQDNASKSSLVRTQSKRERISSCTDDLFKSSEPKKRKQGEDLEPTCTGSVESTSILISSLSRKESFF